METQKKYVSTINRRIGRNLSARVGIRVGLVTLVVTCLAQLLFSSWSWILPFVVSLAAGFASAWSISELALTRIELARKSLRQIRKHRFERLDVMAAEGGDELNGLIRQVDRTGQVVEREFTEMKRLENYRRDFIGNVSHELKTPIFAIRGFAETLLGGALEDEAVSRKFLSKIERNANRLGALAQDLSDISRLEMGQRAMQFQPFSLKRLVSDVLESTDALATSRNVRVSVSVSRSLPAVIGDSSQLRQVVMNLLVNAIKYSDDGGKVRIKARTRKDERIRITVSDNGIGIEQEHIDRLTERFFRVDKSRSRSAGGTGLGLSIVKHILAAHEQVLQIESKPGVGSKFSFDLPIVALASVPES